MKTINWAYFDTQFCRAGYVQLGSCQKTNPEIQFHLSPIAVLDGTAAIERNRMRKTTQVEMRRQR
jgi:hypothetical protein